VKYYIATRGSEAGIVRARKVRDALAAHGHVWTLDWTIQMEANFATGKRDSDLTFEDKRAYAALDRQAVQNADVVLYLEDEKSEGAAGEACFAIAYGVLLVAVVPNPIPRCLFVTMANWIFRTDDAAVGFVLSRASEIEEAKRQYRLDHPREEKVQAPPSER
jgi:hypothetical protein